VFSKGPLSRNNQERSLIIKAAFLIFLDLGHFENTVRSSVGQLLRIRRGRFLAEASLVLPTRWGLFLGMSGACHDRTPLPFFLDILQPKSNGHPQTIALLHIF